MRALKKGDRVRVLPGFGLKHEGWTGTVSKDPKPRWAWVKFSDGAEAPFGRRELRALPTPRPKSQQSKKSKKSKGSK